eukprot:TRINITY_DN925_c0_g1_i2.p1 TRINITY_DN925_c0_g1~~TRINITY_DN925_c0_g1_i2.p1  ORF type:complete len:454 (-),score=143.83 TRINITY_DN925_c0_g1_i2:47-1387(-)
MAAEDDNLAKELDDKVALQHGGVQRTNSSPLSIPGTSPSDLPGTKPPQNTPVFWNIGSKPPPEEGERRRHRRSGGGKGEAGEAGGMGGTSLEQRERVAQLASDPRVINAIQNKLKGLVNKSSGYIESLPPEVQARITALKKIQEGRNKVHDQYLKELRELEMKYEALSQPFYDQRAEIVNGKREPTTEELGDEQLPPAVSVKGVPEFWLSTMKNLDLLADTITEKDEEVLKLLTDIRCVTLEGGKGFCLEFYFDENPFFTNNVIKKTYHMSSEDDDVLERAEGTKIDWKPGKNLTVKLLKKKQRGKGSKHTRTVTKEEPCDSFFNFFYPPEVPDDDAELDDDEHEALQDMMEADYDIGFTLKSKVIPEAIDWFTGEAILSDDDEDEGEDEDEDEDDDDDDDDDDDEDDDEDQGPSRKDRGSGGRGHAPRGGTTTGGAGDKGECKQQ